jgi:hypothetical protein
VELSLQLLAVRHGFAERALQPSYLGRSFLQLRVAIGESRVLLFQTVSQIVFSGSKHYLGAAQLLFRSLQLPFSWREGRLCGEQLQKGIQSTGTDIESDPFIYEVDDRLVSSELPFHPVAQDLDVGRGEIDEADVHARREVGTLVALANPGHFSLAADQGYAVVQFELETQPRSLRFLTTALDVHADDRDIHCDLGNRFRRPAEVESHRMPDRNPWSSEGDEVF